MSKQDIFVSGEAYERTMGRWSRKVGETFLQWLKLQHGLDWLDVGCGNGAFTEVIAATQSPRSLTGIDPSPQQVDYARAQPVAGNIAYSTGAAGNLPYPDASFDASVMALVIGFVPDAALAVSEMKRVTRKGGAVAAYFWDGHENIPISPFVRASVALSLATPTPFPSREATTQAGMLSLWEAAGLQDVETTRLELPVSFKSADDFWDSATALKSSPAVAFLDAASPQDIARVREWLETNLPRNEAGQIGFSAWVNAVKGVV